MYIASMNNTTTLMIGLALSLTLCIWLFWRRTMAQGWKMQVLITIVISGSVFYGFFWLFNKNYSPNYESINTVSVYDQPFYTIGEKKFIWADNSYEDFIHVEASTPNNVPVLVRRIYVKEKGAGSIYNVVYYSSSARLRVKELSGN
jgi:hypothetical protein